MKQCGPGTLASSLSTILLTVDMISRTAFHYGRRVVARAMSTEAAAEATSVKLNFALPHETIYSGASVFRVIIPGV